MASETEKPIIVFDGVCNLCNRSVRFVLRRDDRQQFRFTANQTEAGRQLLRQCGIDPDTVSSIVLVEGDACYVRSEATLRIAARLGAPWRWFAAIARAVPRRVRDAAYRWIARHRYRWFGKRQQCMTPGPEVAHRFYERSLDEPSSE